MSERDLRYEEMLDFSRQNMIKTLELFFEHTKYTLTLMMTVLTAVLAIAAFSIEKFGDKEDQLRLVYFVDAVLLFMLVPIALVSTKLIARYYKLYVACYVYAARLHARHALVDHPWFVEITQRVRDLEDQSAVEDFMSNHKASGGQSWQFYRRLIWLVGAVGLVGSVTLGVLLAR